ncbi:MAG: 30S ribosomal protein S9 [Chloroflexi bacterium]|nr:30S ribosomal protein S9 [Chloroflexota bacterium]
MTTQPSTTPAAQQYYYGLGKRKNSIAQVRLYPDGSQVLINGKPIEQVLSYWVYQMMVLEPFRVTSTLGKFAVVAKLQGGGVSSGAQAMRHGIALALVAYDPNLKKALRQYGLVTRDARVKESKKYGLRRARRAPQYTKR